MPELPGIVWNEGMPVGGVDEAHAEQDEGENHGELDGDHDIVEPRRFLSAEHQHRREDANDERCWDVDDARDRAAVREPDQPTATVEAPIAYSSTRSQPMIHAASSPSVAYV